MNRDKNLDITRGDFSLKCSQLMLRKVTNCCTKSDKTGVVIEVPNMKIYNAQYNPINIVLSMD